MEEESEEEEEEEEEEEGVAPSINRNTRKGCGSARVQVLPSGGTNASSSLSFLAGAPCLSSQEALHTV